MSIDADTARKRLEARKAELERHSRISAAARDAVTLDQQSVGRLSRMDALQQQAMAQANERARHAELSRINAALRRIECGDYGYCLDCGEDIAPKRLSIDPGAALCINCSNKT